MLPETGDGEDLSQATCALGDTVACVLASAVLQSALHSMVLTVGAMYCRVYTYM